MTVFRTLRDNGVCGSVTCTPRMRPVGTDDVAVCMIALIVHCGVGVVTVV